jgi:hypothetical protein
MKKRFSELEPFVLAKLAEQALQEAVYEAIKDHERTGDPVVIWQNGKVVKVSAKCLRLKEPLVRYRLGKRKRK